ncbi:DUF4142 domain-containing protein [Burkholderia plantarii]|uniref:DUF4142 domain-containing protein n=1 Tax=Burkholderia plantarii TaxID=41899 RepID=A0A0B6RKE0_BURPL|nr:DUF4142 domain-containing protein [Burkholderia plantarii]AJK45782.1 hypothetical protein BGL_1c12600 [Burkholderia plantarii]
MMKRRSRAWRAAAIAAALGAVFAASAQTDPNPTPHDPPAADPRVGAEIVKPASPVGDAEIAKRPQGIDPEFVDKASLAGKREVQASQLAIERSASPAVREFAKMMLDDHGRANEQLRVIAAKQGVPAQAAKIVDPDVEALRGKQGHDFDLAYVAVAGPAAHRQAIRLFEAEARGGHSTELRAFAQQGLPMLRKHLAAAQKLAQQVGS